MVVKTIDLFHYIMDRYGEIIEIDPKENHKRFDDVLDTTMPIDQYFERINYCI